MVTYALDFETYYDKECSIKTLGPLGYFSHPNFDAYMVSVVGDDGYKFVGHPKDFDWSLIKDSIVLSHNASFDETLYLFGVNKGWWDYSEVKAWYCTADMAAFCRLPRSLKNATAEAFGLTVDKSTRDNMSGKKWNNMTDEFKEEVSEYALKDSELCLDLWKKYSDQWPDSEKEISNLNRKIVQGGIPIDQSLLKDQLEKVKVRLFEAEQNIPWIEESPLLSRASVRDWRRINAIKKKLESFDYATMPDSRFYGGIMYFGAHTGRFSGSGGNLNLQNLPREEMFGANLRHLIAPKEGKKLIVVDLSQIEVRTLCWLAEDKNMLAEIADTDDIYEAFAIRFKMWGREKGLLKKEDPKLRHTVKALVLGCGYGVGVDRFASMTGFSVDQAREGIARYRYYMPKIKGYWSVLNDKIKKAHAAKVDLVHVGARNSFNDYIAAIPKNGKRLPVRLWGGLLIK
jgi:DNA polymerase I-like protein with 3'-5' exonuclease and polymerase domains